MSKTLPQTAGAVVIGGGIIGLSVLYHLVKAGLRDCVLLEKNELTSGTTWHSAALVSPMRGTRAQTAMARYSGDLYEALVAETGVETGMRRCGHLNIASTAARLEELHHVRATARAFDLETHMVGADEVKRRWPLMMTEDVVGAVWTPSSGRADPSNICQAFAKAAKSGGAKIFEHVSVTGVARRNGRVSGVEADQGNIETDLVINCAGLWGREVGAMAGQTAPLFACEHFYLLTEKMEGVTSDLPVMRDGDAHLYVREEVGGLLVGCFEPNPKALPMDKLPKDSAYILLDEDWDHFAPMMEGALHRIPSLDTAGVRMLLNGPESFTSDNSPLMGEAADLGGVWFCCGMNSAGVVLGGGAGWAMAEWIVNSAPPVDLSGCDVKRFPAALGTTRALCERIPEVLAHHFTVRWPGREHITARGIRRSGLQDRLVAKGAVLGPRSGWEKPLYFDPNGFVDPTDLRFGRPAWQDQTDAECKAARNGVALFDQSSFAKILVQGRDSEKLIQRLCVADVSGYGRAHYTSMLNETGGIESDLTVTRLEAEKFLLVTATAQGNKDMNWVSRHIADLNVTVTDATSALATLLVTGPQSRAALSRITPADLSNAAFPFGTATYIEAGYARVLAIRVSFAGELGWELHIPSDQVMGVYEALTEAAPEIVHAGAHALNALRLEKAFLSYGHDMGPKETPLEVGLGFTIAWNKPGGFIGLEALEAQRMAGISKRLITFTLPNGVWPTGHHGVFRGGNLVGEITSGAYGPTIGKPVALGWVEKGSVKGDDILSDRFSVDIGGQEVVATPSLRAPYDPSGERLKS